MGWGLGSKSLVPTESPGIEIYIYQYLAMVKKKRERKKKTDKNEAKSFTLFAASSSPTTSNSAGTLLGPC